jgi:DNA-directed RNA polymerase specialized sigma24 family protein
MHSLVGKSPVFVTTQWTLVLCAGANSSTVADAALEKLCRDYWYPLYVFVRGSGASHHDAEDLTQGFFAGLLRREDFAGLDRAKGKFRSFLLVAFRNFAAKQRRSAQAQKRGGGCTFISLDAETEEAHHLQSAAGSVSAEQLFARQWAMTLLEKVISQLRSRYYTAKDKAARFDELKVFLTGDKPGIGYADLALKFGTTEGALKMMVLTMRQRCRKLLLAEIANTVSRPEEVDEELHALFAALS